MGKARCVGDIATRMESTRQSVGELILKGDDLSAYCMKDTADRLVGIGKALIAFKSTLRQLRSERDKLFLATKPKNIFVAPTPDLAATSRDDLQALFQVRLQKAKRLS